MRAITLLLFIATVFPVRAAEAPTPIDYSVDADVVALAKVRLFAFDMVMLSERSRGEKLLGRILEREDKIRPLIEVYNQGTPEAKVYALAAFHYLAPELFEQCRKDLRGYFKTEVKSINGCISADGALLEFLVRIHHGEYERYIRKYADG